MSSQPTEPHRTLVQFISGWGEYRPQCSCGWVGSYWLDPLSADTEAEQHKTPPPPAPREEA